MFLDMFSADINSVPLTSTHFTQPVVLQIDFLKQQPGGGKDFSIINIIEMNGTNVLQSQEWFV